MLAVFSTWRFSQGRRPQNGSASTVKLHYFSLCCGKASNGCKNRGTLYLERMPETTTVLNDQGQQSPGSESPTRRRRLLALGLVLSVSFAHFIAAAFYYLIEGSSQIDPASRSIRLIGALIAEVTSLLLLWFALSGQKRTWKDIGWNTKWSDLLHGLGLVLVVSVVVRVATTIFQLSYRSWAGHYLQPRSVHGILGFGISSLSIAFVLVNPFFEELIVRGYTMSEVISLSGSRPLAIFVSVFVQMSYHVYQGFLSGIGLTATFIVFSLYFSKTRRIAPVVLAHFWSDASALIRLNS